MKCDELKDYDYDPDFPFQSRGRFYIADEVEAAFDELKARITDNSALIETLSNELEKLRPMETALEIAEADNKKYIARIKELEKENSETHKSYDTLLTERNALAYELHTIKKTITEGT